VETTVKAWEGGHAADVTAKFNWDGGEKTRSGELDEEGMFHDVFDLPAGTTGKLYYHVTVTWKDSDHHVTKEGKVWLPKCEKETTTTTHEETTTSSSIKDTTSTTEEETTTTGEETTTTVGEETTTSEVLGETSTTAGGALPFTGASSGPMLLAGLGLVGGGLLFLWSSRARDRKASN
jgi:hypothetical protein